jgi:hypothetical protein
VTVVSATLSGWRDAKLAGDGGMTLTDATLVDPVVGAAHPDSYIDISSGRIAAIGPN